MLVTGQESRRRFEIGGGEVAGIAERQRRPGDHEMLISQGPIAIHAYENLTSTDYGAIAEGLDPIGLVREEGKRLRTRSQNTVVRVPPAESREADVLLQKRSVMKSLRATCCTRCSLSEGARQCPFRSPAR